MNIRIENPCHEDWNKMIPESTGAFCKSCAKSVIDFSNKTKNEIKTFFENNVGEKICGRFTEDQLSEMSVEEFVEKIQYYNPLRKFAITLFLTFGFWLFNASNANAQKHKTMGEPAYVQQPTTNKDTSKIKVPENKPILLTGDTVVIEQELVKGQTIVTDTNKKAPTKCTNTPAQINTITKDASGKPIQKEKSKNKTKKPVVVVREEPKYLMGDVAP